MLHLLLFHKCPLHCTVLCAPCAPALRPVACSPSPSCALPVGGRANELLLLVLGIYPGAHWPLDATWRLRGLLPCSRPILELTELTPGDIRVMSAAQRGLYYTEVKIWIHFSSGANYAQRCAEQLARSSRKKKNTTKGKEIFSDIYIYISIKKNTLEIISVCFVSLDKGNVNEPFLWIKRSLKWAVELLRCFG